MRGAWSSPGVPWQQLWHRQDGASTLQEHVLARLVALRSTSHHLEVPRPLVPPLARGDGRVVRRPALQPAPVGDQNGATQLDRRDARPFVVREGPDVVGAWLGGRLGVRVWGLGLG